MRPGTSPVSPADDAFIKRRPGAPPDYYLAEAAGLRWLQVTGGAPVPEVLDVTPEALVISRVQVGTADEAAARRFGMQLSRTHRAGASAYGAPPPGAPEHGWIADLPMAYGAFEGFAPMYAELRVLPYVRAAFDRGGLDQAGAAVFEELASALLESPEALAGPPEPPSRLHGDLWTGNVLWSSDVSGVATGWLIDPAAHGGHRETDLAMLALFGVPHLEHIVAGYESLTPLAPGWRWRVGLHQVYPLLVHAALFGGGYGVEAAAAARRTLARLDRP